MLRAKIPNRYPKMLIWLSVLLLAGVIIAGITRGKPTTESAATSPSPSLTTTPQKENASQTDITSTLNFDNESKPTPIPTPKEPSSETNTLAKTKEITSKENVDKTVPSTTPSIDPSQNIDQNSKIDLLFSKGSDKLPFVETVVYQNKVPWLKGRSAWLVDYASHYETSSYFISRSLTGKKDYFSQSYFNGDKFNVFRKDVPIQFHLVVDISQSLMWFYYFNKDTNEKILLKTYPVGLGRPDTKSQSGYLTPIGTYTLGKRVAIYKPGIKGSFRNKKVEMIRVFGTRWIPFEKEIGSCTAPAKGFGIHGAPWIDVNGKLEEDTNSIRKYESDGCIRMRQEDVEEIFSIIITKPTTVEIIKTESKV